MSLLFPKKPIVKSVDCGLSSEKGLFAWLCLILFDCQMTYMQNHAGNKVTFFFPREEKKSSPRQTQSLLSDGGYGNISKC